MTTRNWGTSTFTPGDDDALAGPDAVGIVERGQPSTRSRLWTLIANESSLDDVLDELSSSGLKALPSFAIAQREDTGVRVVVRGAAHVVVTLVDGSEHIMDPTGVRTWTEELFDGVTSVVLSMRPATAGATTGGSDSVSAEPGRHFVLAGAVPAASIRRDFANDDGLADRARSDWTRPASLDTAAVERRAPQGADDGAESAHDREPTETAPEPTEVAPEPTDTPTVRAEVEIDQDIAPPPEMTPVPDPAPDPSSLPPAPAPNRSRGPFDALDLGAPSAAQPSRLISSVPISSVPGMSDAAEPSDLAARTMSHEPANEALMSEQMALDVPADGSDDVDNLTISRAELAKRRQLGESGPVPGPGQVRAMLCGVGHPNPPHHAICRTCDSAVPAGATVIVERPPLAVLAFSNAERVLVDRSVIIGRNPKVTEASGGGLPRIARFDDERTLGLSRSHAQVVVEGWQMFIEDLHSRNGTELTLPGRARQRLRGGEPVMLEIGAVIHLDDDLTCTVEAS